MARPRSENSALTHVRISFKTKALLDRLKLEGAYRIIDEALTNLLNIYTVKEPQPKCNIFSIQSSNQPTELKNIYLKSHNYNDQT